MLAMSAQDSRSVCSQIFDIVLFTILIQSVAKELFTTFCSLETILMNRRNGFVIPSSLFLPFVDSLLHREDEKFFEMIASIDEFQSPVIAQKQIGYEAQDELELLYLLGVHETSLAKTFPESFLNIFETIEVSSTILSYL
jgi:hypothetical protein